MNTISASLHLTHFHLHRGGDRDAHEHVRVYGRAHVHVYDHGCGHARVHHPHDNAHDELYLKAV